MPGGLNGADHDPQTRALRAWVAADAAQYRVASLVSNPEEMLPYSAVGAGGIVRGKFFIYRGGQANSADLNTVPNFRLRLATRYVVTSMLEVFHHVAGDPASLPLTRETVPSADPAAASLYRVDFDPVDVPHLAANAATQGILRGFEAYAFEPQENGFIACSESVLETYPATALPDTLDPTVLRKVYTTTASDAGNLRAAAPANEVFVNSLIGGAAFGDLPTVANDPAGQRATYTEGMQGITLDASQVPSDRIGTVQRELNPGADRAANSHLRAEPGMLYRARFHLTSTRAANRNAQVRLRARRAALPVVTLQMDRPGGKLPARSGCHMAMFLPGMGASAPVSSTRMMGSGGSSSQPQRA